MKNIVITLTRIFPPVYFRVREMEERKAYGVIFGSGLYTVGGLRL
jgi:hypothetical protein